MTSRRRLWGAAALALVLAGWLGRGEVLDLLGGAWSGEPEDLEDAISDPGRALIARAFDGIDPSRVLDHHVHLLGLGIGSGAWVNPGMQSWEFPLRTLRFRITASGAGIRDLGQADAQYVDRLLRLVRAQRPRTRVGLLAFDWFYRSDGTRDLERSEFHMPNERVFELSAEHPDLFVPVMSVHPYRADAIEALERWAERGGRLVKWLPNAMGIDAADPALDAYYDTMREKELTLLTHVGEEMAVEAEELQELGNPLRFRRPLDRGVRVIMAHCASLGSNDDLDHPGVRAPSFELFMRLLEDPAYDGRLYGEISAMLQFNRLGEPLARLLRRGDLHRRLVNGSDYPLPGVNALIHTGALERQGFITAAERDALDEIYEYNPLLFDFVAKRTVRAPDTGERFAPEVFYEK